MRRSPLLKINVRENRRGNQTMDNPEKPATLDTQDTGRRQTKQTTHYYAQINTNNVNKTKAIQQTIGGKDEPSIVFMR